MRSPIVAGQFYPGNEKVLRSVIEQCFLSRLGPGKLPSQTKASSVKAVICPHAGYMYSGMCAAHSFSAIAHSPAPDLFLLLGLSHHGLHSCIADEDWQTPLGIAKNDNDFTKFLSKEISLPIDNKPHSMEHSLEVQIPFLQFLFKDSVKICPVIISHDVDTKKIGIKIKEAVKKSKKNIILIASSDFTHYGPNYDYLPFTTKQKENLYQLDKKAIDLILKQKAEAFLDYTEETGATICGKLPIATLLHAIDFKESQLLTYYTSGDITNDYTNAVGYASMGFY